MKQQKINALLLLFIPLIFLCVYSYFKHNKTEAQNKELEENGLYGIGKITKYNEERYNGVYSAATVEFGYAINDNYYKSFSNKFSKNNIPKIGDSFMILYLPNEPDKCTLLCDYPVKDSSDYKRYIEEFKTNPPKLGK